MKTKFLLTVALSSAIIALAVSVSIRTVKRAEMARYNAERAASEEETAARESRKAEAEQKAAEAKARAAEADRAKAKSDAEAKIAEQKRQSLATAEADSLKEKAASEASAAKERAKAAQEQAAQAKAEAAEAASLAAKAEAEAAEAKAKAEEAQAKLDLERERNAGAQASAKALELRKIDFETWQTRLLELEQDLAERERALRPEATIYNSSNITWVAEREPDVIGETGTVRRVKREPVRPEDDPSLPRPTRRLARGERRVAENFAALGAASSNAVVRTLERLYVRALEDRRVIDAEYYARSIRLFYPQWTYRPPESAKP